MPPGESLTLWTVRLAAVFYVVALSLYVARSTRGSDRFARVAWTAGFALYAVHVCLAFQFFYDWSHSKAYRETARQTQELFGVNSGGGLYLNYLFTLIWFADALWWWKGFAVYRERPLWIAAAIQLFLAFMFFNAVVVFGHGSVRLIGILATIALLVLLWRKAAA